MGKKNAAGKSEGSARMTPAQKAKAAANAKKVVICNKEAAYDYSLEDRPEAGLSLTGTKVEVLRVGRASLSETWVEVDRNGAWLQGTNTPEYFHGSWTNHPPKRRRGLLLHEREILRLEDRMAAKGYTMVPAESYFTDGHVKVEIALARGKQGWGKRQTICEYEGNREAQRALRGANRRCG